MAKFAPHHSLYKIIEVLKYFTAVIFWAIFILSVLPAFIHHFVPNFNLDSIINSINIICILLFFLLEVIVDYVLMPMADDKRRDDFIDNSFGTKFSTDSSIDYFDNDEIKFGLYKAAVNLFENCFFSLKLINYLTVKRILRPAVVFISVMVIGYFGYKEIPFGLALLQVLFSTTILGGLIRHLILQSKLSFIQEGWIGLFQELEFQTHPERFHGQVYRNWLRYETLHTKIPANIPKKIFNKLNPNLTHEWKGLKLKYNIC